MAISYKKLWKFLIDRDMKKKDLQKLTGISSATVTKLGKNENVSTEIIQKSALRWIATSAISLRWMIPSTINAYILTT